MLGGVLFGVALVGAAAAGFCVGYLYADQLDRFVAGGRR